MDKPRRCPHCQGSSMRRMGYTAQNKQRMLCLESGCGRTFLLDYTNRGSRPGIATYIRELLVAGVGVRATARQLGVSTNVVMRIKRQVTTESERP